MIPQRLLKQIQPKEKEITAEIRGYLRVMRVWHFKAHQGLGSSPGVSDILGCWRGRFLAIEVKTARGTVSPPQQAFLDRVNEEGGIGFVARSVEDVMREVK